MYDSKTNKRMQNKNIVYYCALSNSVEIKLTTLTLYYILTNFYF